MEEAALTSQIVARIVLQEQNRAKAKLAKNKGSVKPAAQRYHPYKRSRLYALESQTIETDRTNTSSIQDHRQEIGTSQEKEGLDTDTIVADHSSIYSPESAHEPTPSEASTKIEPSQTEDLCPTFTSTGSCIATCSLTHNPSKVALCAFRMQGQRCLEAPKCRKSHNWSFMNAPTCAAFMMTRICTRGNSCGFAHNEKVYPLSEACKDFSKLGFCEVGGDCEKIHWFGFEPGPPNFSETAIKRKQKDVAGKTKVAGNKMVDEVKTKQIAKGMEKSTRRSFTEEMWAKDPEELLSSGSAGELALQEDFVPF